MWRYVTGGVAGLALAGAGMLAWGGRDSPRAALLPAAPQAAGGAAQEAQALPDDAPEATPKTREQRRFGRYDKDKDGAITRDEYLAARRKAYAKLDVNGDGRLSFDEWAVKAMAKFATADGDRSGAMTAAEFATTAVKRKPRPRLNCPPADARAAAQEDEA